MSIRSVLRHRAEVRRATPTLTDGITYTTWPVVVESLPCLLSIDGAQQDEPLAPDSKADRTGVLFTLPSADVKPGDRITLTRGQSGTFKIENFIGEASTLHGVSHRELRVTEVPGQ